jgi:type I restriction enzyme R subunit
MIFYDLLVNGVRMKERSQGSPRIARLVDFENVERNDFLCANQYAVEAPFTAGWFRKSDLVVFVNGLPLALFEFRSFHAHETAKDAFYDHQAKMADIPQLYVYAQFLVASDGLETKYGTPTSDWDGFLLWEGIFDEADLEVKKIDHDLRYYLLKPNGKEMTSYEVLLEGLFRKENLLEYLRDFVFHEKSEKGTVRKVARFCHFYSIRKAIERTQKSALGIQTDSQGTVDRRVGIVRQSLDHEKTLAMLLYAKKALRMRELENPLLLFVTDRKNWKEQLDKVFFEPPPVALTGSIGDLRNMIQTTAGGILIAPISTFSEGKEEEPRILSDRRNIVVVADEPYRSQCRDFVRNVRREVPHASFIGFAATPIKLASRSTTQVFGEPIGGSSRDKLGSLRLWFRFVMNLGFRDFIGALWGPKKSPLNPSVNH